MMMIMNDHECGGVDVVMMMIMNDHECGGGDDEGDDDESDDDGDDDVIVVTLKEVILDISFFFCTFYNLLPVPQTITNISSCDN